MKLFEFPPTFKRVRINTKEALNESIDEETRNRIKHFTNLSETEINKRIDELNKEWDTERTLEANFAGVVLLSSILGFTVNKKWFAAGSIASIFMLQHALQGWCPPLPIIRHIGIRTANEINEEKNILKLLQTK
ncbi:MAG: DUF2892 domain-containing protein [Clostridiales bacterium]|nr:DUF2892 domain-containing protein [Clostridiales bacterium]MCF8023742.1 DUF2892 domain-containing protein [Clostridiales bacterium]